MILTKLSIITLAIICLTIVFLSKYSYAFEYNITEEPKYSDLSFEILSVTDLGIFDKSNNHFSIKTYSHTGSVLLPNKNLEIAILSSVAMKKINSFFDYNYRNKSLFIKDKYMKEFFKLLGDNDVVISITGYDQFGDKIVGELNFTIKT